MEPLAALAVALSVAVPLARQFLQWSQEGLGSARDTVSRAYQYASSTQSLSIARCHWVSFRVQDGQGDLTETEPGLCPFSAYLL